MESAHRILEQYFGYTTFRSGQEELIDAQLAGRDAFGVMPTGGGKSLCYQIPALLSEGITLVVSPLISLMKDQVAALRRAGIPVAYINSSLSYEQIRAVYHNLAAGQYKLVYVAPERLATEGFVQTARRLNISLFAVDEAHCISQWGQDFRPSYLKIVDFLAQLERRPVVSAFTATATPAVREDVERILALRDPLRVVTGFDRPNLRFEVLHPQDKNSALLSLVRERQSKSGIVYCATRREVESVCELLRENGIAATRYHAGLDDAERQTNQEDFDRDRSSVIVATNAFGMGIDKSNVAYVIHYNMPQSMEAYYQEAGRAGRDGSRAECVLLYAPRDIRTARFLIERSTPNEELSEDERRRIVSQDLTRLEHIIGYCKTTRCLRGYILDYFGERHVDACGNCGNCESIVETQDITTQAQMILSCVKRAYDRLGYSLGATGIAGILRGSSEQRILSRGLDHLSTYGLMRGTSRAEVRTLIELLEAEGYLHTDPVHEGVSLTERAGDVLFRGERVEVTVRKAVRRTPPPARALPHDAPDDDLLAALKSLRTRIAAEENVPAYVVFTNASLIDMAQKRPTTLEAFLTVSGVGSFRAARYGARFLETIRAHIGE